MKEKLENLLRDGLREIGGAGDEEALLRAKGRYLGRKGELSSFIKTLGTLPEAERRAAGELINNVKSRLEEAAGKRLAWFEDRAREEELRKERVDVTLPGRTLPSGKRHPVAQVLEEIEEAFVGLGFEVAEGPEVELDHYNFEALNIPKDHPARDMQDTFYITDDVLLRTHTSPVQIRVMEKRTPPLRVIAPGTVYRRDSDITHTPMFHQIEGFMVGRDIAMSDLKGVLTSFLRRIFGPETGLRFRPSFFPFTEPSAEVDISCRVCGGAGCRVCKGSGWLEVLGCGMIHPEVFRSVNYDPEEFTGFAFGLGIERIAMLRFGIDDIRLFFENDLKFLRQF